MRALVVCLAVIMTSGGSAIAGTESVEVVKTWDDNAIIGRRNGDMYLIEKGTGCMSLGRYEGRDVLVVSPGSFLGVGSALLIPEADQRCRVWNAELLSGATGRSSPASPPVPVPTPVAGKSKTGESVSPEMVTIRKALRLVGLLQGSSEAAPSAQTITALDEYRKSKGYPLSEDGLRSALTALALDVVAKNPSDQNARRVSLELLTVVPASDAGPGLQSPASPPAALLHQDCEDGHWIASVSSDGEIVTLEDGSVWEIDALDRLDSMLWLPTESITLCGGRFINTDAGDAVDARRID